MRLVLLGKAQSNKGEQLDPRETFSAYSKLSQESWIATISDLADLDVELSIQVADVWLENEPIRLLPSSGETYAIRIPETGVRAIPAWAILRETLGGSDRDAAQLVSGDRLLFPATITWRSDQVLSAYIASGQLA